MWGVTHAITTPVQHHTAPLRRYNEARKEMKIRKKKKKLSLFPDSKITPVETPGNLQADT